MTSQANSGALVIMEAWGKGGTETYVAGLVRTLLRHGHDVRLVLLREGDTPVIDGLGADRITVTGLPGLYRLMRDSRPCVASLHLYTHLLPVVALARLLSIPVVGTLHIPISSWGLRHRIYWGMAIRLSTKVVGVSQQVVDEVRPRNGNMHPRPLPGGIAPLFFQVQRRGVPGSEFAICAAGRLEYQKDWPTLVRAVALLPPELRARAVIHFYGSGTLQRELESQARGAGVQARFHGYVEKSQLAAALSTAHLNVLPSRFEGLGLSAIEAMAAGVPTITADFAAANDFIESGKTGHTFPTGDAGALSKTIAWHMHNPVASEEMGRNGRDFVRRYSAEETYLPYLELFRQVAA